MLYMDNTYLQLVEDTRLDAECVDASGLDSFICFDCAKHVKNVYPDAKILGFVSWDNAIAELSEGEDGHDFALIEDRYIVDIWAFANGVSQYKVLDLKNDTHKIVISRLYGDIDNWLEFFNSKWETFDNGLLR